MNTSYEKLSFYNSFFSGMIDGDNIMTTDFYGNKQPIGVTLKKYQETKDLLKTYYDKLVELGVLEEEKTPEEVAKEQQEMMKAMMLQMKEMQEKIDSFGECKKENENDERRKNIKYREQTATESVTEAESQPINRKGKGNSQFGGRPERSID
jgi:hypothetical protein